MRTAGRRSASSAVPGATAGTACWRGRRQDRSMAGRPASPPQPVTQWCDLSLLDAPHQVLRIESGRDPPARAPRMRRALDAEQHLTHAAAKVHPTPPPPTHDACGPRVDLDDHWRSRSLVHDQVDRERAVETQRLTDRAAAARPPLESARSRSPKMGHTGPARFAPCRKWPRQAGRPWLNTTWHEATRPGTNACAMSSGWVSAAFATAPAASAGSRTRVTPPPPTPSTGLSMTGHPCASRKR